MAQIQSSFFFFSFMSRNSFINCSGHPELRMRIHFVTSGCGELQHVCMGGFMAYLGSVSGVQVLSEEKPPVRNCPAEAGGFFLLIISFWKSISWQRQPSKCLGSYGDRLRSWGRKVQFIHEKSKSCVWVFLTFQRQLQTILMRDVFFLLYNSTGWAEGAVHAPQLPQIFTHPPAFGAKWAGIYVWNEQSPSYSC